MGPKQLRKKPLSNLLLPLFWPVYPETFTIKSPQFCSCFCISTLSSSKMDQCTYNIMPTQCVNTGLVFVMSVPYPKILTCGDIIWGSKKKKMAEWRVDSPPQICKVAKMTEWRCSFNEWGYFNGKPMFTHEPWWCI